jgi:hypothetical protein
MNEVIARVLVIEIFALPYICCSIFTICVCVTISSVVVSILTIYA